MHRRHANIMHEADAKAHRQGACADPKRRRSGYVRGISADADDDDANKKGDQRRQHEIVDRAWKIGGQHGDEVHRPDAGRERNRRSSEGEPSAEALGRVQPTRERQPDEAALDRNRDGKNHEPGLVRNHHPASLTRRPREAKVLRLDEACKDLWLYILRHIASVLKGSSRPLESGAKRLGAWIPFQPQSSFAKPQLGERGSCWARWLCSSGDLAGRLYPRAPAAMIGGSRSA